MSADTAGATGLAGYERVSDAGLAPGELRQARLADGTLVCVGNARGEVFAIADECPHASFSLSDSSLLPDGTLECACHGARFDVHAGRVLRGPATEPPERFEVVEAEGGVWVRRRA